MHNPVSTPRRILGMGGMGGRSPEPPLVRIPRILYAVHMSSCYRTRKCGAATRGGTVSMAAGGKVGVLANNAKTRSNTRHDFTWKTHAGKNTTGANGRSSLWWETYNEGNTIRLSRCILLWTKLTAKCGAATRGSRLWERSPPFFQFPYELYFCCHRALAACPSGCVAHNLCGSGDWCRNFRLLVLLGVWKWWSMFGC
jgi:hypothetical protein